MMFGGRSPTQNAPLHRNTTPEDKTTGDDQEDKTTGNTQEDKPTGDAQGDQPDPRGDGIMRSMKSYLGKCTKARNELQ